VGVGIHCPEDGCNFHLTDDNTENLAATLPRLECLELGTPGSSHSCNTTVASLLSISTRCLGLTLLETHFNTLAIVGDVQRLFDGDSWRGKARCKLQNLTAGYLPVEVGGEDIETVVNGFRIIFPYLLYFSDYGRHWYKLQPVLGCGWAGGRIQGQ